MLFCLLLAKLHEAAEEVEAVGCVLCLPITFQSSLSSGSELALPVFCFLFRQKKAQRYSSFCNSQSLFSFLIWRVPFRFICLWNEAIFSCILVLWPSSANEKDQTLKDVRIMYFYCTEPEKKNQAVKTVWATERSYEEVWVLPEIFRENRCLYSKLISNKNNLSCLEFHMVCNAIELEKQEQDAWKFIPI